MYTRYFCCFTETVAYETDEIAGGLPGGKYVTEILPMHVGIYLT